MAHRSRGCLRCRQRRVKCDQGRPACQRCVTRNEVCVGYRDDLDLFFHDQTSAVVQKNRSISSGRDSSQWSSPSSSSAGAGRRARSRSLERLTASPPSSSSSISSSHEPQYAPWLNSNRPADESRITDEAVSKFMDNYVIYPCNESSSPGFLEHLPGLFKEVNVNGRFALRWAVQATALADFATGRCDDADDVRSKALEYYGRSLSALGKSLAAKGKEPDDHDLMTVVILDIFETFFIHDENFLGSHTQGMAHILRLRGHEQFHDPRGWGLFRLAHHRLQKERLAKKMSPLEESPDWLSGLNNDMSFVRLEKGALDISSVCERARSLLSQLQARNSPWDDMMELVRKMNDLDQQVAEWRQRPEWSFKTLSKSKISGDADAISRLPDTIEIHRDVWMAYEWNYHRTGRIILHQTLLECLLHSTNDEPPEVYAEEITQLTAKSMYTVLTLADQVLSTVPQSLGDIDCLGQCRPPRSERPRSGAVGAYFLLWPIKIIKGPMSMASGEQKQRASLVFDEIRERTGMKARLGSLSCI